MNKIKRKLIIFNHLLYNYTISNSVLLMSNIFKLNRKLFTDNDFEIIYFKDLVEDHSIFEIEKNQSLSDGAVKNIYVKTFNKFILDVEGTNKYDNCIFLMFSKLDFKHIFEHKYDKLYRKKGIRKIIWRDDIHFIGRRVVKFDMAQNKFNYPPDAGKILVPQYEMSHFILSPSKLYFHNVNSIYLAKTEFFFYCYNEYSDDTKFDFCDFSNRKNKILLTGSCDKFYSMRFLIKSYKWHGKKKNVGTKLGMASMADIIDIMKHPGYNDRNKWISKMGSYYYNTLKSYKACFFGFGMKPLNFCLAKIVEILACGCIGFFEYSPRLEIDLGLKPFVHYVPIKVTDDNKPIFDKEYYMKYLNNETGIGLEIAKTGHNYIINNFSSAQRSQEFIDIINRKFE
jgi:hypothetical protein